MTPEQRDALRKAFPTSAIGKLPKGGVMLDFAGHAAVTDRLLAVDPAWTWEPVALDEHGLPAYDRAGGLWIRLTVCGVTRLGYGDGPDPKQRIGDAIRNAAMRFGVALDLWSRQELESVDPNGGDAAAKPRTAEAFHEKDHKRLVRETLADPKKATRSKGQEPDDPWASVQIVKPGSEAWLTEWGAEVEAATTVEQLRELHAELKRKRDAGDLNQAQFDTASTECTALAEMLKAGAA